LENLVKHETHEGLFFSSYCRAPKHMQKSETTSQSSAFTVEVQY